MESYQKFRDSFLDLETLISKMSKHGRCSHVLSEFGLGWEEVSIMLEEKSLSMIPASVALVLLQYSTKFLTDKEVIHIIARLKLTSIAIQPRTWHVIILKEQLADEPVNVLIQQLPSRVMKALKNSTYPNKQPQVQTIKLGQIIFVSVQTVVTNLQVYVASRPGDPVALVSTLNSQLLRACIQGLGYRNYQDARRKRKGIASSLLNLAAVAPTLP